MDTPILGEVQLVGFNFAPVNWGHCAGGLIAVNDNQALYALLGTTYGGNGRSDFALPDLRGRTPVGVGSGPGLDPVSWGEWLGQETITLTENEMPIHTHSATATFTPTPDSGVTADGVLNVSTKTATVATPSEGDYLAVTMSGLASLKSYISAADAGSDTVALGGLHITASGTGGGNGTVQVVNANSGGGTEFSLRNPAVGMYFVMSLAGVFPSRN